MRDGLVDLVDGCLEFATRRLEVLAELLLEVVQAVLEVGDVDVLLLDLGELMAVLVGVARRVAQDGDDRDEELRPDDVHLGIAVRDVDDARVVQLAVGLEQADQHRVLALLVGAVAVELLEMVLVALVVRGLFLFVFHLEHDRDDLVAVGIELAEDVVALGALDVGGVLLEVRVLEGRRAELVELDLAVLLERLAEHLGVEAGAHVAHALYLAFAVRDDRVLDPELLLEL